ncbi:unnamed protein product, partial [Meganyctiphanes norvegica]
TLISVRRVSTAVVLLFGVLQVARAARSSRALGYGASGGGSCKFWCERGGGQYYCCQTPEQTALQTGGHLPQTSGFGSQGVGNFGQTGGYGSQGVGNFGSNFGQTGGHGAQGGNNFGHQGAGGHRPQVTVLQVTHGSHQGAGSNFGHQGTGGYRPQVTHGSHHSGNTGFRPTHGNVQGGLIQGGSGFRPTHGNNQGSFNQGGGFGSNSNNNLAALSSIFSNLGSLGGQQNNQQQQGHSSNFVANPSIVTPLGHNDAISTVNRPINQGSFGNSNGGVNPNNFAFQGVNGPSFREPNQGVSVSQGLPNYPFDVRGNLSKQSS